MSEFYTILTDIGLAAFANAAFTGTDVQITSMGVGTGEDLPTQDMTELQNLVWAAPVTRLAPTSADDKVLECEVRIPPDVGGWTIREVGLFDADGHMLAVGNVPPSYKPLLESGSAKDMQIRMYIQHQNADKVTVLMDPAIIMATQSYVNDAIDGMRVYAASALIHAADNEVRQDVERSIRQMVVLRIADIEAKQTLLAVSTEEDPDTGFPAGWNDPLPATPPDLEPLVNPGDPTPYDPGDPAIPQPDPDPNPEPEPEPEPTGEPGDNPNNPDDDDTSPWTVYLDPSIA